jgi:hypothetical protein
MRKAEVKRVIATKNAVATTTEEGKRKQLNEPATEKLF